MTLFGIGMWCSTESPVTEDLWECARSPTGQWVMTEAVMDYLLEKFESLLAY